MFEGAFKEGEEQETILEEIVEFWWIQCLNFLKAGWEVAYIHDLGSLEPSTSLELQSLDYK
jgi:hypothetical protein